MKLNIVLLLGTFLLSHPVFAGCTNYNYGYPYCKQQSDPEFCHGGPMLVQDIQDFCDEPGLGPYMQTTTIFLKCGYDDYK